MGLEIRLHFSFFSASISGWATELLKLESLIKHRCTSSVAWVVASVENERPVYHAACKILTSTHKDIELAADVFDFDLIFFLNSGILTWLSYNPH